MSADILQSIAESYVKLVLGVGQHDADYVDAYFGPKDLLDRAKAEKKPLSVLRVEALDLLKRLQSISREGWEEIEILRHLYLTKQISALVGRVEMLDGRKFSFDGEAAVLYDANPPTYPESHFQSLLGGLGAILPGAGNVSGRYDTFKGAYVIPKEKLDAVFQEAIRECRKRTSAHIALPPNENFTIEYVTNKSWSGYNWYKGSGFSLIQMNTDLPIYIDRAIDLAAHEGYPGHHVYNSLLESELFRKRGWIEFSVYALFSPQSLIAEGTANFGIEVAFPGGERVQYEERSLFLLAGMDPSTTELYYRVHALFLKLAYAGNEAARAYLNGTMTRAQAVEWLVTYALMSKERAEQRTRFFDTYRSYVINYNLGQDLVRGYIERRGGTSDKPARRWEEFKKLISSPRLPSGLAG
ncbi:MAG TPA: hypothetical protein VLY03_08680 [Bacteroidota bacterium]|nr:hypothetical protein [Bacteroidota bacterium]